MANVTRCVNVKVMSSSSSVQRFSSRQERETFFAFCFSSGYEKKRKKRKKTKLAHTVMLVSSVHAVYMIRLARPCYLAMLAFFGGAAVGKEETTPLMNSFFFFFCSNSQFLDTVNRHTDETIHSSVPSCLLPNVLFRSF